MRARLAPFFFLAPGPAVIYGFVLLLIFVHAPSICDKTVDTLTLLPPPQNSFIAFIWTFSYIQATLKGGGACQRVRVWYTQECYSTNK